MSRLLPQSPFSRYSNKRIHSTEQLSAIPLSACPIADFRLKEGGERSEGAAFPLPRRRRRRRRRVALITEVSSCTLGAFSTQLKSSRSV